MVEQPSTLGQLGCWSDLVCLHVLFIFFGAENREVAFLKWWLIIDDPCA